MNNEITVSLFKNGRFHQLVSGPEDYVINPTLALWEGDYEVGEFDNNWWFSGKPRMREACPVVVDGRVLRGVRPSSVVTIEGKRYECAEGGDVALSFQFPGTYQIRVSCWPYLDGSYTVENPPPTK